jgi:hypothetical protein
MPTVLEPVRSLLANPREYRYQQDATTARSESAVAEEDLHG